MSERIVWTERAIHDTERLDRPARDLVLAAVERFAATGGKEKGTFYFSVDLRAVEEEQLRAWASVNRGRPFGMWRPWASGPPNGWAWKLASIRVDAPGGEGEK